MEVIGGEPVALKEELHEKWTPYPYHNHSMNPNPADEVIEEWAKDNRKILWNNDLWGENGSEKWASRAEAFTQSLVPPIA